MITKRLNTIFKAYCLLILATFQIAYGYSQTQNKQAKMEDTDQTPITEDEEETNTTNYPSQYAHENVHHENTGLTFRSYKPTQFLYAVQSSKNIGDPNHFQLNLSPEFHYIKSNGTTWGLVYNCEYGFYMTNLYSGPIISRLQNPFYYREWGYGNDIVANGVNGNKISTKQKRYGFAIAHESNGMMIDKQDIYKQFTSDTTLFAKQETKYHNYNSMGWNYLEFRFRKKLVNSLGFFDQGEYGFEYRFYVNQSFGLGGNSLLTLENNLFIDTAATKLDSSAFSKITIRNYDGIRFFIKEERIISKRPKTNHKIRLFYQMFTGIPVNYNFSNFDSYKISQKFELAYGAQWNGDWGTFYVVLGYTDGYNTYLSSYPCFRSIWYLGVQAAF